MSVEDVPSLRECGDGHYGRREFDKARDAWQRAADTGDALAMAKLASLYEEQGDLPAAEHWYRPMRGLRTDRTTTVIIAGLAFIQNLRRGHYELGVDVPRALRVAEAFDELAQAI